MVSGEASSPASGAGCSTGEGPQLPPDATHIIQQEVLRVLGLQEVQNPHANMADLPEFLGNLSSLSCFSVSNNYTLSHDTHWEWIVDTGATAHMCCVPHLMATMNPISYPP